MNWSTLYAKAIPSLLAGTSKRPLPDDLIPTSDANSFAEMALLSLTGQGLRFERPPGPESFVIEPDIKDERKIIADGLRRPLIRLLTAKGTTEHPARALARAFDRLRLRPHPFDLPLIDAFVRSHAERLGPTAQHWADRQKPEAQTQSYFDPEVLDESSWAQAAVSRRVAYMERRRREDADSARALLESTWAQDEPEARFRLLQALQAGLSASDQPFLSTLEKDRAPRVRALASRYLARLGSGGENPALRECLERIKQGESGVLRKRKALQLELPANVKDQAAWRWVRETFVDVSISELAAALGVNDEQLIEAAGKDEPLLLSLALTTTNDRRLDLLEVVVKHLPNCWERMFESGLDTLGMMTDSERERWQEIIARPYGKDLPTNYYAWDWLHKIAGVAAPASVMSMVLQTKLLANLPERERGGAPWLEVMAAVCPATQRQELRGELSDFDPSQSVNALALVDILDGMEKERTHV